jgi:predicted NBD/HSP70 family sugar kinase
MGRSGDKIFKKGQLTIGLDLGDRSSCYCVLDENGEIVLEQKLATTPGSNTASMREDGPESHRDGDGHALAVGQPDVGGAGARSDRGARAERAFDRQEPAKR